MSTFSSEKKQETNWFSVKPGSKYINKFVNTVNYTYYINQWITIRTNCKMERRGLLRNCQNEGIDVHICPDEFLEKETRIKGRRKEKHQWIKFNRPPLLILSGKSSRRIWKTGKTTVVLPRDSPRSRTAIPISVMQNPFA